MKSIIYINKKDKDKIIKVKSIALLNKIKLDCQTEAEADSLPDDAEILIMKGLTKSELDKFLSDLRKKGIRIGLKCIETETNKKWPLRKLYEEIKKEHDSLERPGID